MKCGAIFWRGMIVKNRSGWSTVSSPQDSGEIRQDADHADIYSRITAYHPNRYPKQTTTSLLMSSICCPHILPTKDSQCPNTVICLFFCIKTTYRVVDRWYRDIGSPWEDQGSCTTCWISSSHNQASPLLPLFSKISHASQDQNHWLVEGQDLHRGQNPEMLAHAPSWPWTVGKSMLRSVKWVLSFRYANSEKPRALCMSSRFLSFSIRTCKEIQIAITIIVSPSSTA